MIFVDVFCLKSKSTWTWRRNKFFIFAFNERHDELLFSFFVVDEIFNARNQVMSDSFMKRTRRFSKMIDLWTITSFFMRVWAHSRSSCMCKIDRNLCLICVLFYRIFCESSTTCFRFAYDIAHVFIMNSNINRWKNVCFDLENRHKRHAKDFKNISKTFVLNDNKLVDDFRFFCFEYMSNRRFVNEN
jgi:hypothetical protein